jgi:hypothetical protein
MCGGTMKHTSPLAMFAPSLRISRTMASWMNCPPWRRHGWVLAVPAIAASCPPPEDAFAVRFTKVCRGLLLQVTQLARRSTARVLPIVRLPLQGDP